MFEQFTARGRQAIVLARDEALFGGHPEVLPGHLLVGLAREEEGLAARVLEGLGVTTETARAALPAVAERTEWGRGSQVPFGEGAKKALELALRETLSLGHNYVGTEHLLLALARQGLEVGAPEEQVREAVVALLARGPAPTPKPSEPEGGARLQERLGRLGELQMELARRGFYTSVTTFKANHARRAVPPEGDRLRTLEDWDARLNVVYERFDGPAMRTLEALAAERGCHLEWSQKHGATFYPRGEPGA